MTKPRLPNLSIILWIASAAWCGVLFFFSGQSGSASQGESLGLAQALLNLFPFLPWTAEALNPALRKLAHFGIFAVEGALTEGALTAGRKPRKRTIALAAAICALLAALNEFHQSFIPGRSGRFADALIDFAGGLAGALFAHLLAARLRGKQML